MALFKVYKGNESNLPTAMNDGWAYFCTDSGNFFIDWLDGETLTRTQINANYASNLKYLNGEEYAEIDATTLVANMNDMRQDIDDLDDRVTQLSTEIAQSDWNASEGEPGYVKNRTHWIGTETIDPTFDGDMTGRETVQIQEGAYAVKVSPQYVDVDTMVGATMTLDMGGAEQSMTLTAETVMDASEVFSVPGATVLVEGETTIISLSKAVSIMGLSFAAGTWFMCVPDMFHVKALSCLDTEVEIIHKLDEKFLPDDIGGGGIFTVTVSDDESGNCTADKSLAEMASAYMTGKVLQCMYNETILHLHTAQPAVGAYAFTGAITANQMDRRIIMFAEGSIYMFTADATVPEIPTKLPNPYAVFFYRALGGTATSIKNATYGTHKSDGSSALRIHGIANPYALTINGTTYDGSAAVDMTDVINGMIDSKLASMAAAEEVSF